MLKPAQGCVNRDDVRCANACTFALKYMEAVKIQANIKLLVYDD